MKDRKENCLRSHSGTLEIFWDKRTTTNYYIYEGCDSNQDNEQHSFIWDLLYESTRDVNEMKHIIIKFQKMNHVYLSFVWRRFRNPFLVSINLHFRFLVCPLNFKLIQLRVSEEIESKVLHENVNAWKKSKSKYCRKSQHMKMSTHHILI